MSNTLPEIYSGALPPRLERYRLYARMDIDHSWVFVGELALYILK